MGGMISAARLPRRTRSSRGARRGNAGGRAPRVLVVVQNIPLRFDRRVRSECRALLDAGYGVTVVCPKDAPDEPDVHELDGVTVRSYPAPPATSGLLSYVREFAVCWLRTARLSLRTARAEGFDVLQACNPPDTYWLLGLLWRLRGKKFVYDQHDLCPEVYEARFGGRGPLHRILLLLERATYATADRVVSPNPSYQEVALERGKLPVAHTTVVMSSPDPAAMVRGQVDPSLRHGRRRLACYVGIMGPQDGVDRLLDAIAHYVHTLNRDDCHFALLGYGDSLEALLQQRDRLGIAEYTTFTGRVDQAELSRWLSTADIGVTPDPPCEFNHRSTMNKTLEYMAHGVPVVSTDLRETRRCAGPAAEYVPDGEPAALAKTIATVIDNPARRREMALNGRLRIERLFAWPEQARAYVDMYDELLGRAQRQAPATRTTAAGPPAVAATTPINGGNQ
ncbi:glycosyltransferase family 4 protein [Phytoactinopolyspora endophytica]|uniref:glycosyltransferase family 4 protein n=1 Tax=Phytoactinopolyspora endophytica TaxID=1642495 RepID=UPI00197C1406|nr:glycosyltransferase family 4 protein [Phytoactinopolyspora endophytica]